MTSLWKKPHRLNQFTDSSTPSTVLGHIFAFFIAPLHVSSVLTATSRTLYIKIPNQGIFNSLREIGEQKPLRTCTSTSSVIVTTTQGTFLAFFITFLRFFSVYLHLHPPHIVPHHFPSHYDQFTKEIALFKSVYGQLYSQHCFRAHFCIFHCTPLCFLSFDRNLLHFGCTDSQPRYL